ncbi:CoA transferase [Escherichia albertii]|uniref:CoA transferase n=1 Tax=Escherichia albertii TaxID=208962 RepID=A0AAX3MTH7_ESCAL|nr:CoA transferase [Escherichia albertii]MCZ8552675.1 CoA transferase [Escherichia albertii]WDB31527.1 CoA transferase [Escherichia albertii]WDC12437.1 CoA transferase [Escherichia albertii]
MRPLEGIKVVDLTSFLAAPTVARLLGDWGADVIKIEPPTGDPGRTQASVFNMPYEDDENPAFDISNANKRFLCLNLKKESAKAIAYRILATADVVVTSYRTKALERLGFSWEELHLRFPRLIFAQILGYGEKGPEKDTAGFDATAYVCRGGILGSTNERGETPINSVNGFGDFQASMCLVSGICAALYGRTISGKGDKVTVSLHHTALFMMSIAVTSAQYGNVYPKSRCEVANPFNNTYKTSDGRWMVICIPEYDRYFNKFMQLLGREDLIDSPEFCRIADVNRFGRNRDIINVISEQVAKRPLREMMRLLKDNDFAHEKGYTPDEILQDEQAWATDCLRNVAYPTGNQRVLVTPPVTIHGMGGAQIKPSRRLGHHSQQILAEYGYTPDDIYAFSYEGAVIIPD